MSRATAYQKFSSKIYYTYYCSKCNAKNHKTKIVKVTGSASQHNIPWTNRGWKKLEDKAHNTGMAAMQFSVMDIFLSAAKGDYRAAELNTRCSLCGHREPWAKTHFSWVYIPFTYLILLGFLGAMLNLYIKEYFSALLSISVPVIPLIIIGIILHLRENAIKKQIALLPQTALPVFSFEDKDLDI